MPQATSGLSITGGCYALSLCRTQPWATCWSTLNSWNAPWIIVWTVIGIIYQLGTYAVGLTPDGWLLGGFIIGGPSLDARGSGRIEFVLRGGGVTNTWPSQYSCTYSITVFMSVCSMFELYVLYLQYVRMDYRSLADGDSTANTSRHHLHYGVSNSING